MNQITLTESNPYRKRAIRFLGVTQNGGWRIKTYGICAKRDVPGDRLIKAAKELAFRLLPQPASDSHRYGAATLIIHEGNDANYVLVDWWAHECMLQHAVYSSPSDAPEQLTDFAPTGVAVCTWELHVLHFESRAWLESVLANPAGPDLEAYFARHLNTDA